MPAPIGQQTPAYGRGRVAVGDRPMVAGTFFGPAVESFSDAAALHPQKGRYSRKKKVPAPIGQQTPASGRGRVAKGDRPMVAGTFLGPLNFSPLGPRLALSVAD